MSTAKHHTGVAIEPTALPCLPIGRWVGLAILLIAEFLLLSLRFDTASLTTINAWWAAFLGQAPLLAQIAVSTSVLFWVIGGRENVSVMRQSAAGRTTGLFNQVPILVHIISVAGFFYLCTELLDGESQAPTRANVLAVAWFLAGGLALASWFVALFPSLLWQTVPSRRLLKTVAFCSTISIVVFSASALSNRLWIPLGQLTFQFVEYLLSFKYSDLMVDPDNLLIGTDSFSVRIAPSCSGYEGIGMIFVFLSAFLWWNRKTLRFPRSFLILPIGIAAVWIANAVRIAVLVYVGSSISQDIALGGFHSQAGWLTFNAIALSLCVVVWSSPWFLKEASESESLRTEGRNPATPYLLPFIALLGSVMLTNLFSSNGFCLLYPLRVLVVGAILWHFRSHYLKSSKFVSHIREFWHSAALGVVVFAFWFALEPEGHAELDTQAAVSSGLSSLPLPLAIGWLVFRAIGSVIVVPIAEELAFRGYLTRRIISKDFASIPLGSFSWSSMIGSSVAFGLLHDRWIAGSFAGVVFALALYRRGRLADAIIAHATTNGLITCAVLASRNWSSWS